MSATYEGPAVLVDDDGREVPVTARLGVFTEMMLENFGDPFYRDVPGWKWWGGLLEAETPIVGRFVMPWRVRMPDGQERKLYEVSGDGAHPNRVEVKGDGEAPWDWEAA